MTAKTPARLLRDQLGSRYRPEHDHLIRVFTEALGLSKRLEAKAEERFTAALAAQQTANMRVRVRTLQLLGLTGEGPVVPDDDDGFDDF